MSKIDFEALIHSGDWEDRLKAARAGEGLEDLVHDSEWIIRAAVAKQGYGLAELLHDPSWCVRVAVAEQGYGLETLLGDEAWIVRKAVAEQGYGLDVLVKDSERYISDFAKKVRDELDRDRLDDILASAASRCDSGVAGECKHREMGLGG